MPGVGSKYFGIWKHNGPLVAQWCVGLGVNEVSWGGWRGTEYGGTSGMDVFGGVQKLEIAHAGSKSG